MVETDIAKKPIGADIGKETVDPDIPKKVDPVTPKKKAWTGNADIAKQLVDVLRRPDGSPDLRPVHAIGIGVTGYFEASDVARDYCIAEHFLGGQIPVKVRFSNGSGCKFTHDGWSDVRGMAAQFELANGATTDLIAMTLPEFFAPTPEGFLEFAIAAKPAPVTRESPWQKFLDLLHLTLPPRNPYPGETISPDAGAIRFADQHDYAKLAVSQAGLIGAPVSYVRAEYHAVHTFVIVAPDGARRWVRFSWQPVFGVLNTDPEKTPIDEYLQQELRDRLAKEPARFTLMMAIGEAGDDFDDCSRPWPPHRVRIMMGTLTLNAVPKDQDANSERLAFNPMHLTTGIEASDDPVLHVRGESYDISRDARLNAPRCPFSPEVVQPTVDSLLDRLDRFVLGLPKQKWFQFLSTYVVVPFWARRYPTAPLPGGPRPSVQPSENVQRMMNLIMPLKDKSAVGRANAAAAIANNVDEIFSGLDNVGTVHFARFLLIGDYICMISVYDGDFTNYIRDFIATIGSVFDEVMKVVEGGDKLSPTTRNIEAFIDWVHDHDLFQAPDFPTDLFTLNKESGKTPRPEGPPELRSLPREFILQLHANPNVSLGGGYRGYPGVSVADVRRKFGVGW
jgi:catalase